MQQPPRDQHGWDPFPSSQRDKEATKDQEDTPQTLSPTYRLAFDDADFLTREELRGVRLQLEMMKPEMALIEAGILSTVVLFGGARIPEPGTDAWAAKNDTQKRNLEAQHQFGDEFGPVEMIDDDLQAVIEPRMGIAFGQQPQMRRDELHAVQPDAGFHQPGGAQFQRFEDEGAHMLVEPGAPDQIH